MDMMPLGCQLEAVCNSQIQISLGRQFKIHAFRHIRLSDDGDSGDALRKANEYLKGPLFSV